MPDIQVLDKSTVDQIAAGEVVEKPASVVKELVENAIDAKASAITVEIKEGGVSFIRITDNGCGIPKEQIGLAFLRHSTSKIRHVEDLHSISSLGFRGEALSSVSAVAKVELITKTPEAFIGARYEIEGGKEKKLEEIGAPEGTTMIVRSLFYNTPARKKFLKTAATEGNHIQDLVERLALSHPHIAFKFINNNQVKVHTSGNANLKDAIYQIYGRDIAANLLEVNFESEEAKINGYIGKSTVARGNRQFENYFVNGRYVKSALISKSIEHAYKDYMMQHKYPFTVLLAEFDGKSLDVNVHPTKMELRFSEEEKVFQLFYKALHDVLAKQEMIGEASLSHLKSGSKKADVNQDQAGRQPKAKQIKASNLATHPTETEADNISKDLKEPAPIRRTKGPKAPEPFETNRLKQEQENEEEKQQSKRALAAYEVKSERALLRETPRYGDHLRTVSKIKTQIDPYKTSMQETANGKMSTQETSVCETPNEKMSTQEASTCEPPNGKMSTQEASAYETPNEKMSTQEASACEPPNQEMSAKKAASEEAYMQKGSLTTQNKEISEIDAQAEESAEHKRQKPLSTRQDKAEQLSFFEQQLIEKKIEDEIKIIGQAFDTYWILQFEEKMYLIDQHAAHEKVLYERLLKKMERQDFSAQMISPPLVVSVSATEAQLLKEYGEEFEKIGFEIEPFGGKEYAIHAVPTNLLGLNERDLFLEMLDDLSSAAAKTKPDMMLEKIASMACKAAVKGNQKLSLQETKELLYELMTLDNPYHCPHGRPVIVAITKKELEKMFKRIV